MSSANMVEGLADWFDPKNPVHIQSFIDYMADGEIWPDNGTKPKDIFMHTLWERRCVELMALEWIRHVTNSKINLPKKVT